MRKLLLFILPMLLLTSITQRAYALRVGDIEVYSALNQPLEAEITIVSDRPGEAEGMIVKLASEAAFEQQGVNWVFHLTKLKFGLSTKPDGAQIIKVSTRDPVREPFLDFLVDIDWPTGRLVRKFTILLDPPVFAAKTQTSPVSSVQSNNDDSGFFLEGDSNESLPDISVSATSEPSLIQRDDRSKVTSDDSASFLMDEPLSDEPISETAVDFDEGSVPDAGASLDDEFILDDLTGGQTTDVDQFEASSTARDEEAFEESAFDTESTPDDGELMLDEVATSDDIFAKDDEFTDFSSEASDVAEVNGIDESAFDDDGFDVDSFDTLTTTKQGSIPDISVTLDESIPYDVERTQRLLAEFALEDGERVISSDDYEVQAGDYLQNIASGAMPEGVSINQAMLAILRANPDAFLRDNINNIKKGAVLRIPNREEMLAIDGRQALIDVQQQNGLWREYKNQLAGTASASDVADQEYDSDHSSFTSSDTGTSTQLSIVAPGRDDDTGQIVSGQDDGVSDGTTADTNLLLAQEALEAERLEKIELQDRLKDLEEQVSMMQRLITLKDQKYAQLQAQLSDQNTVAESDYSTTDVIEDSSLNDTEIVSADDSTLLGEDISDTPQEEATEDALQTQLDDESLAVDADEVEDTTVTDDVTELAVDETLSEEESDEVTVNDDTALASDESVGEDDLLLEDTTADDLNAVAEPQKEGSYLSFLSDLLPKPYAAMLEDFLSKPYGLAAFIILPILLIVAVIFGLRRSGSRGKSKEKSIFLHEPPQDDHDLLLDDDIPAHDEPVDEPAAEAAKLATSDFNPDRTQTINDAVQEAAIEAQTPAPAAAPSTPEPVEEDEPMDDTTAEADVYLAYGLFDQAEDLLKQALADNPDRHEYRGKLLETYFAEGKKQEFEALARELKSALGGNAGRLWDKAVAMGKEIAPDSDLFSGTLDSGLKASDFAPAKPEATDIELGGETAVMTDVDLVVGSTDVETDFDLGIDDVEEPESMADTIISPADTISADEEAAAISDVDTELEFDLSDSDDLASEIDDLDADLDLDLDFNADDLGLGDEETDDAEIETILEAPAQEEPEPEPVLEPVPEPEPVMATPEETVALDMDLNLDELDLGDIGDTDETDFDLDDFADAMGGSDEQDSPAADELLAEIDAADLDLTMPGELEVGEDTIIEDEDESDETIITADIDFDETFTGDSDDDDISMDEVNTKLDLARAYIDMGDNDGASSTLNEVIAEGSDQQRQEAKGLLSQIG